MKANEEPGKFTTPAEVRLVHTLPGPIERVRAYLMDLEKRARWLAGGVCEPKVGGKNDLVFQHKNLSPNEEPPEPPSRGVGPCSNFDPPAKTATSRCHPPRPRRGSVPTGARFAPIAWSAFSSTCVRTAVAARHRPTCDRRAIATRSAKRPATKPGRHFASGKRTGRWKFYDPRGKLIRTKPH